MVTRVVVLAAVLGFAYWRFFIPKIHTASEADIAAVVPKTLLQTTPPDPDAEKRLKTLVAAINKYDTKAFRSVINRSQPDEVRAKAADALWNDGRLNQILSILDSGEIRIQPSDLRKSADESSAATEDTLGELSRIKQLERALIESASVYRQTGHSMQSLACLLETLKISDKFWSMQGPLTFYLEAFSVESSATRAVQEAAADPRTTPADCSLLLKAMIPSPIIDDCLINSMKNEFNWEVLPKLPDPYKDFKEPVEAPDGDSIDTVTPFDLGFKTSYNAIETATELGKSFSVGIENAGRPYSKYSDAARQIQQKAAAKLPMPPDLSKLKGFGKKLEKFKFRITTYNTDNYYGRVMITDEISDQALVEMSARWRALRNTVRVLLASRVYRASHGGALPTTIEQFGPVLGVWPADPYDASPLKYNAERKVVYSIGQNLKDDGGKISGPSSSALDVGVSLNLVTSSTPKQTFHPRTGPLRGPSLSIPSPRM